MSIPLSTQLTINAPGPVDTRLQVDTFASLSNIAVVYVGLKTYIEDENKEYRYYSGGWQLWSEQGGGGGGGAAVWGSITGTITNQADLMVQLGLKFDKTGGFITGDTTILAKTESYNFVLTGSTASAELSPFAKLVSVPASASSTGIVGEYAVDGNFAYFCIATNTWVRSVTSTWV